MLDRKEEKTVESENKTEKNSAPSVNVTKNDLFAFAAGFSMLTEEEREAANKQSKMHLDQVLQKQNDTNKLLAYCRVAQDLEIYKKQLEQSVNPGEKAFLEIHVQALTNLKNTIWASANPNSMFQPPTNTNKAVDTEKEIKLDEVEKSPSPGNH